MGARYRLVRKPGSRKTYLEHRVVMERVLARKLRSDEQVHHINGDTFDNRPENLRVVSAKEHAAAHDRQKHPLTKPCVICGTVFRPHPTKRARKKTCSLPCRRRLLGDQKRGERQPRACLTPELVIEARRRVAAGERISDVAREKGVTPHTMANAVAGRTWAHLTDPPPIVRGSRGAR